MTKSSWPLHLAVAGLFSILIVPVANAAEIPADPSAETMCLLYYKLANQPPPLDVFAATDVAAQRSNEFDQQKAIDAEKAKLEAQIASLATVTTIRISITMSMGEYDSGRGEYDLSGFTPDQFMQYVCFHKQVLHLRFDNAEDAQSWVLPADAAEAALNKNQGDRRVTAVTTVELTGIDTTDGDNPLTLVGKITDVAVYGQFNHAPLGHYAVQAP